MNIIWYLRLLLLLRNRRKSETKNKKLEIKKREKIFSFSSFFPYRIMSRKASAREAYFQITDSIILLRLPDFDTWSTRHHKKENEEENMYSIWSHVAFDAFELNGIDKCERKKKKSKSNEEKKNILLNETRHASDFLFFHFFFLSIYTPVRLTLFTAIYIRMFINIVANPILLLRFLFYFSNFFFLTSTSSFCSLLITHLHHICNANAYTSFIYSAWGCFPNLYTYIQFYWIYRVKSVCIWVELYTCEFNQYENFFFLGFFVEHFPIWNVKKEDDDKEKGK